MRLIRIYITIIIIIIIIIIINGYFQEQRKLPVINV